MSDLIQLFRQQHVQVQDDSQIQWCKQRYSNEKDKLIKLLRDYDCDVEGFSEYMKVLVEMANIKAYPSLRSDHDTARDFHKYHSLVYQIYDKHYHSN